MKVRHVSLLIALAACSAPSFALNGKLVPNQGILTSVGQDVDSVNDYASAMGVTPAGVTNYVGIVSLDGLNSDADAGAGRNNVVALANQYPTSALIVGVSMNGQIAAVANGTYNANIDTLLNTLGQLDRPVYLRWAYEVDGPWNGHNPEDLKRSFRYVHQRILDLGHADAISLIWQVASYCPTPGGQLSQWWPGADVVDWVGLSYFAPQDCNWDRVNEAAQWARTHNKPVFINESTPQRYQTSDLTYSADPAKGTNRVNKSQQQIWNEWFAPYFQFMTDNQDIVKGFTYINADWDSQWRWAAPYNEGYWGDSRVQVQPQIKANWQNELAKTKYINHSEQLFAQLGYDASGDPTDPPTNPPTNPPVTPPNPTPCDEEFSYRYISDNTIEVFHKDKGWSANWNYVCLSDYCLPGVRENGEFTKQFSATLGQEYGITFKVEDNQGQQIIDKTITFENKSCAAN
ncbi:family 31 carbohydrate-binding protein [Vibrio sp. SM6]|uniref:Family 31 carbohydrate-binding protein n=1 Tax=Vibrio agarilyticus TaxID=2726741 RepID=A0A7X8TQA0_9VIBR|nr:family 31 carbohydrate-binding protein [Vibrio agarilyticus]NLS12691.1 family 31 carbohydrate-binding protein [Vibrio agarilyticus]